MRPQVTIYPEDLIQQYPARLQDLLKAVAIVLVLGWLLSALTIRR